MPHLFSSQNTFLRWDIKNTPQTSQTDYRGSRCQYE